jgi:hypothetical protein
MAGRVFKRGQTYHIAFSFKGVEYRKSALTDKKREAENLLAFYLGQCARGEFQGFGTEKTLSLFEMLDDYVADYQQRGLRDMQIVRYRTRSLREFFKDIPVEDVTERKIDLYHQASSHGREIPQYGQPRFTSIRRGSAAGEPPKAPQRRAPYREVFRAGQCASGIL